MAPGCAAYFGTRIGYLTRSISSFIAFKLAPSLEVAWIRLSLRLPYRTYLCLILGCVRRDQRPAFVQHLARTDRGRNRAKAAIGTSALVTGDRTIPRASAPRNTKQRGAASLSAIGQCKGFAGEFSKAQGVHTPPPSFEISSSIVIVMRLPVIKWATIAASARPSLG